MEERNGPQERQLAIVVYALLVVIPTFVVWAVSGSALGALAVAGLILVLILMSEWGGGRGLSRRLRTRARDESAPYDEPPDRPLSRWQ